MVLWEARVRPSDAPDPRAEDSPIRYDDKRMDRQRSRTSLAELFKGARTERVGEELPAEPLHLPEIPPERLAYLRRRRDEILAELREHWPETQ